MLKHKVVQSGVLERLKKSIKCVTKALRQNRRLQIANGRNRKRVIWLLHYKDIGRKSPAILKRVDVPKGLG